MKCVASSVLIALAGMIASGNDKDGEFARRLAYIIGELKACQEARGDGSLDGIPGSRDMWAAMSKGIRLVK